MFNQIELQQLRELLNRVDLKGNEAVAVANLQRKILMQLSLDETTVKREAEKLDKKIDETAKK